MDRGGDGGDAPQEGGGYGWGRRPGSTVNPFKQGDRENWPSLPEMSFGSVETSDEESTDGEDEEEERAGGGAPGIDAAASHSHNAATPTPGAMPKNVINFSLLTLAEMQPEVFSYHSSQDDSVELSFEAGGSGAAAAAAAGSDSFARVLPPNITGTSHYQQQQQQQQQPYQPHHHMGAHTPGGYTAGDLTVATPLPDLSAIAASPAPHHYQQQQQQQQRPPMYPPHTPPQTFASPPDPKDLVTPHNRVGTTGSGLHYTPSKHVVTPAESPIRCAYGGGGSAGGSYGDVLNSPFVSRREIASLAASPEGYGYGHGYGSTTPQQHSNDYSAHTHTHTAPPTAAATTATTASVGGEAATGGVGGTFSHLSSTSSARGGRGDGGSGGGAAAAAGATATRTLAGSPAPPLRGHAGAHGAASPLGGGRAAGGGSNANNTTLSSFLSGGGGGSVGFGSAGRGSGTALDVSAGSGSAGSSNASGYLVAGVPQVVAANPAQPSAPTHLSSHHGDSSMASRASGSSTGDAARSLSRHIGGAGRGAGGGEEGLQRMPPQSYNALAASTPPSAIRKFDGWLVSHDVGRGGVEGTLAQKTSAVHMQGRSVGEVNNSHNGGDDDDGPRQLPIPGPEPRSPSQELNFSAEESLFVSGGEGGVGVDADGGGAVAGIRADDFDLLLSKKDKLLELFAQFCQVLVVMKRAQQEQRPPGHPRDAPPAPEISFDFDAVAAVEQALLQHREQQQQQQQEGRYHHYHHHPKARPPTSDGGTHHAPPSAHSGSVNLSYQADTTMDHSHTRSAGGSSTGGGGLDRSGAKREDYSTSVCSVATQAPPQHPHYRKASPYACTDEDHASTSVGTQVGVSTIKRDFRMRLETGVDGSTNSYRGSVDWAAGVVTPSRASGSGPSSHTRTTASTIAQGTPAPASPYLHHARLSAHHESHRTARGEVIDDIALWAKSRRAAGHPRFMNSSPLFPATMTAGSAKCAAPPYSLIRTRYLAMMDAPWMY